MDPILVSFSFLAGLSAFFAPCSIALIPAYVGYYVSEKREANTKIQQLLFGLKAGIFASLGQVIDCQKKQNNINLKCSNLCVYSARG